MSITTCKQIAIVVVVAVLAAFPALAQTRQYGAWKYNGDDTATTYGDVVGLSVGCRDDGVPFLSIGMLSFDRFRNGNVELSFDEGTSYMAVFENNMAGSLLWADTTGNRNNPSLVPVVVLDLIEHVELRLRFNVMSSNTLVSDRISLIGSTRAIGALPCP